MNTNNLFKVQVVIQLAEKLLIRIFCLCFFAFFLLFLSFFFFFLSSLASLRSMQKMQRQVAFPEFLL